MSSIAVAFPCSRDFGKPRLRRVLSGFPITGELSRGAQRGRVYIGLEALEEPPEIGSRLDTEIIQMRFLTPNVALIVL